MVRRTDGAGFDKRLPRLKKHYPLPFFLANSALAIHALVRAAAGRGATRPGWLAAAATHAVVAAHVPRNWPRRTSSLASLAWSSAVGTAITALVGARAGPMLSVTTVGLAGSTVFRTWFATFGRRPSDALTVGSLLPELTLRTLDGRSFSTTELRGQPAALFFYRGAWCPFCTTQIRSLAEGYEQLAARGVRTVMISPQPQRDSQELARRFDVDMLWLTDPDLTAAAILGIVELDGVPTGTPGDVGTDTVLPTLIVVDENLHIIGAHETNEFRRRPDATTVLDILDGLN
ncbi:peroxiredoxin family protein [Mycobacterium sp.]|uniref:peroxiredoxin family protein n=1 Tax=Mycobacterium sp. TaxID=1785 RepID=UPI002B95CEEF|nr:peroxiredoxin family protein [Mycobacterium sp.]HME49294.1 peroxiredoxin family protein [Mycobacterium sp.]